LELNADFSLRAVQHGATLPWKDSPMRGVRRRMLERIGDEVARATTIVCYEPNSRFLPHVHGGGEEFIVLEGVFEDEHGAYPTGSYIRNPPQSRHTLIDTGLRTIRQAMAVRPADRTHVRLNFDKMKRSRPLAGRVSR
jgi:anti-sigma factor ChrR (cupin superfamily)